MGSSRLALCCTGCEADACVLPRLLPLLTGLCVALQGRLEVGVTLVGELLASEGWALVNKRGWLRSPVF